MSFIFFIGQWVILILIALIAYSRFLVYKKDALTQQDYHAIKQKKSKSETDLDILYNLLKNKNKLNTKTISKLFKISKEKALEWAKILENHELVTIEYPTFTHPEVRINEEQKKEQQTKKQQKAEKDAKDKKDKKTGTKGFKPKEKGKPTQGKKGKHIQRKK